MRFDVREFVFCPALPWVPSPFFTGLLLVFAVTALLQVPVSAQVGRYYINTPVDTHLVSATYSGVRSNTWADPDLGDGEIESRSQTVSLSYAFITSLNGRTGGFGIVVPRTSMLSYERGAGQVLLDRAGWADLSLTFDYNLFGAPALSPEEFGRHIPGNYAGLHFSLNTPTGDYDTDREVNIGSNRWALKNTLNYSVTRNAGVSWWDFYPSVRIFADNSAYLRTSTLSQAPLWGLEAHYSHNISGPAWGSVGLIGSVGGRTRIDGETAERGQRSLRLATGAGFPVWPRGAAIVTYSHDLLDRGGASRINRFMLQLMHKF